MNTLGICTTSLEEKIVIPWFESLGGYICILSYYVFNGNQAADLPHAALVCYPFLLLRWRGIINNGEGIEEKSAVGQGLKTYS
jgi:hypothetical protein